MTTAVVTGATGFIGGHLVDYLLAEGHEVHVMQRSSSSPAALESFEARGVIVHRFAEPAEIVGIVGGIRPGLVFHLATHYLKDHVTSDLAALLDANVAFGTYLLEGLVGSSAVVVSTMSYFQFEDGTPQPFSLYSATKQAFLDIAEFYRVRRGIDVRQVVLYDTYGPDDTRGKLIPHLVSAAVRGDSVSLGAPLQELNLLYSTDVCRGLVAAAAEGAPAMMALRAPADYPVREIVEVLGAAAGHPVEATYNGAAPVNDRVRRSGDWPTPPGWTAEVSLLGGLSELVRS